MSVTIDQIVQGAQRVLGEVDGIAASDYSEPRLIDDAGRAFNMLFKKRFWEQYTEWNTVILDGTTGIITTDTFTNVRDFDDFAAVHRTGNPTGLPTLHPQTNPTTITGTVARCWTALRASHADFAGRKLKIYPVTAVGSLDVRARFHPLPYLDEGDPEDEEDDVIVTRWQADTVLELDEDLLVYGCAFMALSGDDMNPQAKSDVQNMMDIRYSDIMKALGDQKMDMRSPRGDVPREWFSV